MFLLWFEQVSYLVFTRMLKIPFMILNNNNTKNKWVQLLNNNNKHLKYST